MQKVLSNPVTIAISSSVISAILIGTGAAVWQSLEEGALIRALGGMPRSEVPTFPSNAILIVDDPQACEGDAGWETLVDTIGQVVIGASLDTKSTFHYRKKGGEPDIILTNSHVPDHIHFVDDIFHSEDRQRIPNNLEIKAVNVPGGQGSSKLPDSDNVGWVKSTKTGAVDYEDKLDTPHTNFPPYVALFFCKRRDVKAEAE